MDTGFSKKVIISISIGIIIFVVIIMIPAFVLIETIDNIKEFLGFNNGEESTSELYANIIDVKNKYAITLENGKLEFYGALPMPVNDAIVTSEFGARIHPITGKLRFHTGIDLVGDWHSNIISTEDGTVIFAGTNGGYGNCVEIEHIDPKGEKYYTLYAHLARIDVNIGQEVKQGNIIGIQGGDPKLDINPGSSTGTHLHFEIRKSKNGDFQNPRPYLFENSE